MNLGPSVGKTRHSVKPVSGIKPSLTGKEMRPSLLVPQTQTPKYEVEGQPSKMLRTSVSPTMKALQEQQSQPFEISPLNAHQDDRFDTSGISLYVPPHKAGKPAQLRDAPAHTDTRRDGVQIFHTTNHSVSAHDLSCADTSEFIKNDLRSPIYVNDDVSPGIGPGTEPAQQMTPKQFYSRQPMALTVEQPNEE